MAAVLGTAVARALIPTIFSDRIPLRLALPLLVTSILFSIQLVHERRRLRQLGANLAKKRAEPPEHYAFNLHGLEWDLRQGFWQNYQHFTPKEVSGSSITGWIIGPFCPTCWEAIDLDRVENACCHSCPPNSISQMRQERSLQTMMTRRASYPSCSTMFMPERKALLEAGTYHKSHFGVRIEMRNPLFDSQSARADYQVERLLSEGCRSRL